MDSLRDLVVVELAGSMAGAYCAKLFADQGAAVHLVGQSAISPHQASYLHRAKTDAPIDLATADVIIESSAPEPLVPSNIDAPGAVRVQLSPFGTFGARAHWRGTDLVDYAASGHSYLYGDPEREPLRGPPDQPAVAAGLFGFVGAMAALFSRERVGGGQVVDISHHQVMAALHQVTLLRWMMTRNVLCRMGNRYTGQGQPNGPYRAADGWVSVSAVTTQQIESVLAVSGLTHLLDHPDIDSPMGFQSHPDIFDEPFNEWIATQKADEVVELFQAMRIPTSPARTLLGLLDDAHLAARDFFVEHGDHRVPGSPFSFSHHQPDNGRGWRPEGDASLPLAGLRVLDLTRVWAGPLCTRILGDLGADVVTVEAPWARGPKQLPESLVQAARFYPDNDPGERPWNRSGHFVKYALGKQSLALDLATDQGREVLARLVPQFDVLVENFSTRVMPQLGFDEARLHELHPDLIYVTMPGFGRSGPAENWLAYGSSIDSHAGLSNLNGYRGEAPWKGGIAWPDPVAGLHATCAVLGALWAGQSGGQGRTIEAAQLESTIAAIGDRLLEAQVAQPFLPDGNRQPGFVAQGVYRCAGDDSWVALSLPDGETAERFAACTGVQPDDWSDHDHVDVLIGRFTATEDPHALAELLQASDIPAAPVAKASDLAVDPHLASRDAWVTVDQPDIGTFTAPVTPIWLSASPARMPGPAPTLGEHNESVLLAAGFDATEIAELAAAAIIATEPPE